MNIIFCNIRELQKYKGVDLDNEIGNDDELMEWFEDDFERSNFENYNEKCYGFVYVGGSISLNKYYKDLEEKAESINDVLVVWFETNDENEIRIIGWYKNATVFRKNQSRPSFLDNYSCLHDYYIEAPSEACYLIPKNNRNFKIERSALKEFLLANRERNILYAGSEDTKCSIVPKVIDYIENYSGEYENKVSYEEIINAKIDINSYENLLNIGKKYYEEDNFEEAIKYFNSAKMIKETEEVDIYIADTLYGFELFDKAILMYINIIRKYGGGIYTVDRLIRALDLSGEYKDVIKVTEGLIKWLDNKNGYAEVKIKYLFVLFEINLYYKDEEKCNDIISRLETYAKEIDSRNLENDIERLERVLYKELNGMI